VSAEGTGGVAGVECFGRSHTLGGFHSAEVFGIGDHGLFKGEVVHKAVSKI
jgi:hypothetical protein